MGIYSNWLEVAYDQRGGLVKKTWDTHLPLEQAVYEKMLETKNNVIKGKFSELAAEYGMSLESMAGFLDGISAALNVAPDMDEIAEGSEIDVVVDFETLYKKMVEYKAEHLVALPQWDNIFSADERKKMFIEQKKSGTVVVGEKVGRNDPCTCGSGKKYKKCCGAVA
ncbi:MAG: SEC-C metal-binding domain-containing protein [Defluviitaleaceae bacterium]|nr:SEC-C metal-binding domain-containing protein [Defluviitaleaceae bacterium]